MGIRDSPWQVALERRESEQAGPRVNHAMRIERRHMAAQSRPKGVDAHQWHHVGGHVVGCTLERLKAGEASPVDRRWKVGHDADRQIAETGVRAKRSKESLNRRRAEALTNDNAIDVATIEMVRRG